MVDLGVTVDIRGRVSTLARLASFLRELDTYGVEYSVTLSHGDWSQTYDSEGWREAIRSPTFGLPDE